MALGDGAGGHTYPCAWCCRTKQRVVKVSPGGEWALSTAPYYYVCEPCFDLARSLLLSSGRLQPTRRQRIVDAERARRA